MNRADDLAGGSDQVGTVAAEEDEPAWSHLQRIAVLNNFTSIVPLLRVWSGVRSQTGLRISPKAVRCILAHLCESNHEDDDTYLRHHGIGWMLFGRQRRITVSEARSEEWDADSLCQPAYVLPPHPSAKFCPSCHKTDVARRGFTWFRRIHQVAGIEFCPSHGDRLMQRASGYRSLWREPDETQIRSESCCGGLSERIESAAPEIRVYANVIAWRWQDETDASMLAVYDLIRDRFERLPYKHIAPPVYDAISYVSGRFRTQRWFRSNFGDFFENNVFVDNFFRWLQDHIPLTYLAVALIDDRDSIESVMPELSAKLRNRLPQKIDNS